MKYVELLDPSGRSRGVCEAPTTALELLRLALGLRPNDLLVSLAIHNDEWALAVVYAGDEKEETRVVVTDFDRGTSRTRSTDTLAESAWLRLIEEGWSTREIAGS